MDIPRRHWTPPWKPKGKVTCELKPTMNQAKKPPLIMQLNELCRRLICFKKRLGFFAPIQRCRRHTRRGARPTGF